MHHPQNNNLYHVQVGHTKVVVTGATVADAIANARRKLGQEMPRFYDIIRDLESTRFTVQRAA